MKRLFFLGAIFVLCFSLAGCKQSANGVVPQTENISFSMEISFYNDSFQADATITEADGLTINFTHPEDISGLVFNVKSGNITASYKGLEYKTETSSLPQQDIASFIYEAFKNSDSEVFEEDDRFFIEGKTCEYGYKLYLGLTGLPLEIEEKSGTIHIIIKNPSILNN